jgi:hypothetical protein
MGARAGVARTDRPIATTLRAVMAVAAFAAAIAGAASTVPSSAAPSAAAGRPAPWVSQTAQNVGDYATVFESATAGASDDAWAVGWAGDHDGTLVPMAQHFDGETWSSFPPEADGNGILFGVARVSADDVWAVGALSGPGGDATLAEHWNGTAWAIVPTPAPPGTSHLEDVYAFATNDVWAVGERVRPNGFFLPLVEHWNGHRWKVVTTPVDPSWGINQSRNLLDVGGAGPSDLWAVGWTQTGDSAEPVKPLIEHWDGAAWTIVPSAVTTAHYSYFNSVITDSSGEAWAVGTTSEPNFTPEHALIEHWDGAQWTVEPYDPGNKRSGLVDVEATPDGVWSIGYRVPRFGGFPLSAH